MKKLCKNQNGAISAFVMLAMVFFLVTILGIYMISSKRAQTQSESLEIVQAKYYTEGEENEKYQAKIAQSADKIPIYTKEQLWAMGSDKAVEIEGKVYDFSKNDFSQYELKNDIVINIDELGEHQISEPNGIQKNSFEIYYYKEGKYYIPSSSNVADLTVNGKYFKYKNISQGLGYVTNGIVTHYDGIRNMENGHDTSSTIWKDLSGNGNDGILSGCSWNEDSLVLDGKSFVNANANPLFNEIGGTPDMTVEVVSEKNTKTYGNIIGLTNNVNNFSYMSLWTCNGDDGRCYSVEYSGTTGATNWQQKTFSYTDIPLNTKNSISYGKDAINYFTYFNANKKDEVAISHSLGWKSNEFYIGRPTSNNYYFTGKIYSVRVYKRALTQEEISQNYEIDKARFGIE